MPRDMHDDREGQVRHLHALGMGWSEIGLEIGLTPQQVFAIGRRLGLTLDRGEVRARMSEASKKAWADPEVRARMSEARKKAWADPEVRARMSEASKKAWADPEVRARMSEASKKALADPEVRARMSEASKGILVHLNAEERADYDLLKRNGYSRQQALIAIGRGDLLPDVAEAR